MQEHISTATMEVRENCPQILPGLTKRRRGWDTAWRATTKHLLPQRTQRQQKQLMCIGFGGVLLPMETAPALGCAGEFVAPGDEVEHSNTVDELDEVSFSPMRKYAAIEKVTASQDDSNNENGRQSHLK